MVRPMRFASPAAGPKAVATAHGFGVNSAPRATGAASAVSYAGQRGGGVREMRGRGRRTTCRDLARTLIPTLRRVARHAA
jgi:hypothetical protein